MPRAASSEEFERSNGSYSVANNQGYFEYIIKKQDALTVDPPIRNKINKIGNRITFKMYSGYYIEIVTWNFELLQSKEKYRKRLKW